MPTSRLDVAIRLARRDGVVLASYTGMLRVPGSRGEGLIEAKAGGADIRIVYSTTNALKLAQANPDRRVILIACRHGVICRATADGAVWISSITPDPAADTRRFKVPATLALAGRLDAVPQRPLDAAAGDNTFGEIAWREANGVGWLSFDFLNGAMSVEQCSSASGTRARPRQGRAEQPC